MRTIKLYGELGKRFGKIHRFMVKTPAEAVRALCANFPEFERYMLKAHEKNVGFHVWNGRHQLDNADESRDPASGDIKIVPVIMGANATTRIIIGSVLVIAGIAANMTGVGAAASPYLISAGVGLMLGGVIELLSPVPKIKEPEERPENKPSYLFNGPVNTTNQGHPVPVGYGRLLIGGGIVSAGISIDQIMAGYRRVRVERTTTRIYYRQAGSMTDTFKLAPGEAAEPSGVFRKEQLSYQWKGITISGHLYDKYVFTLYYYETVTEAIPV
jgi:predicted phage tail protein